MLRAIGYFGALLLIMGVLGYGVIAELSDQEDQEDEVVRVAPEDVAAPPVEAVPVAPAATLDETAASPVNGAPKIAARATTRPIEATPEASLSTAAPLAPRNVTPPGVLPGPEVTAPLTRVPGFKPPKKEKPPPPKRLHLIVVQRAGIVRSKGRTYTFSGVVPTPLDTVCRDETGTKHPCGQQAATALKRFIRKRAIDCAYEDTDDSEGLTTAQCQLGNRDVSEWLVSGGWVRAAADAPQTLKDLEDEAREARRGLWRHGEGAASGG